jgi:hypothetical protein
VIWLITIATFLGVVVAVMFVFWFFSQREQILTALRKLEEQRREARIPTRVGLELSAPVEPLIYESTFTENVSYHGARVVTKTCWSPNDCVLVKLPQECLLNGDEFAMGLQFSLLVYDWIGSAQVHNAFPSGLGETVVFGDDQGSSGALIRRLGSIFHHLTVYWAAVPKGR